MANTIVVGRVAIRVYPDTSYFRTDLQTKLKAMADVDAEVIVKPKLDESEKKRVQAELDAAFTEEKVKVVLDASAEKIAALRERLKVFLKDIQAKINPTVSVADIMKPLALIRSFLTDLRVKLLPTVNPSDVLTPVAKIKAMLAKGIDLVLKLDDQYVLPSVVSIRTKVAAILGDVRLKLQPTVNPSDVLNAEALVRSLLAKGIDMILKPDIRTATVEAVRLRIEEAFRSIKAKVIPNLDETQAFRVLHNLKGKFDVKAKVSPDLKQRSVVDTWIALKALLRPVAVKVKPELDKKAVAKVIGEMFAAFSGARMGGNFFKDFFDKFKELDKEIPKLLMLIPAIGTLAAGILNLSGNLISLVYSLGQVFPLVLALPSVLMGAAASFYILYASFKDLKKFMPELAASFKGFKESIGKTFWNEALSSMRGFLKGFIPEFTKGMLQLSAATGDLVASIANGFQKHVTPVLGVFFASWTAFTNNFGKAGDAIGSLFATFITIGDDIFPRMGTAIANATIRLDEWFNLNTANGNVMDWINLAWTRLSELWRVLTGMVDLVAALGRAIDSAGGTSLKSLGDTLHSWADTLSSPENQSKLAAMFGGAGKAMDNFWANARAGVGDFWGVFSSMTAKNLPVLGASFGTLIGAIMQGLSGPKAQSGITSFFKSIDDAINILRPHIETLVSAVAQFLAPLGQVIKALAPILGWVMDLISYILADLGQPLADMISSISAGLMPILKGAMPALNDLFKFIGEYLPILGAAIKEILDNLGPVIILIIEGAVVLLKGAIEWIGILVVGLAEISGGIKAAGIWLGEAAYNVATWFGEAATNIGKWFSDTATNIGNWAQDVGNAIVAGFSAVFGTDGFFATIIGWIDRNIVQPVKDFLGIHSPSTVFAEIGGFLIQGLIDGITNMAGSLGSTLGNLVNGVVTKGTEMASNFMNTVRGLKDSAVAKIVELKDGAISALNYLAPGAGTAMANFVGRVGSGVNDAMGTIGGIASRALGAAGSLGSILWSAGSSLLQGLINGINARVNDVKNLLNWLTSKLPSWKGPYDTDKALLTPAGETIMQSLIDGFKNGAGDVKDYLQDFTTELGKTSFQATVTGNRNLVSSIVDAGVNGASTGAGSQTLNVTNYYPQAEPTSRTVNRALELAMLL